MKYKKLIVLAGVFLVIIFTGLKVISTSDSDHALDEGHGHTEVDIHDDHSSHGHGNDDHGQEKSSQVTVWDDRFEIFIEHPFVVANKPTKFVTHVTDRMTLKPRRKGSVTFVLTGGSEISTRHVEQTPVRDGIYIPKLTFPQSGIWNVFLIILVDGNEYIVELPTLMVYKSQAEVDLTPCPEEVAGVSFLKEQQWEMSFATEAVQQREIHSRAVLAVPESAIVDENGKPVAFVQLAGETFEKRYLKLGQKEHGFIQVLSGLSKGEYVTTDGAYAVAEAEHKGDEDHEHEEHEEESIMQLSEEDMKRFSIEVDRAGSREFEVYLSVPGEIVINTDLMAHIVPRVPGIVREVKKKLGDPVKKGEVMAVMESRDLADAKTAYLASIERFELANTIFKREDKLWKEKISSEQEYLDAKKAFAEAKIEMRSAEQKLRALGFNAEYLEKLPSEPAELLTTFEITAPFNGIVIQKHISLGEVVKDEADIFVVADLDTVWVDLRVHQKDVGLIRKGQKVIISAKSSVPETKGVIGYVAPVIDEKTRTALARVVLDNTSGLLRPGTFVTVNVLVKKLNAEVVVAKSILQDVDDKTCIFIKNEYGFEPRPVTIGWSNDEYVEIIEGLRPGETIVTKNSFRLKAELEKSAVGGHDVHGHAH